MAIEQSAIEALLLKRLAGGGDTRLSVIRVYFPGEVASQVLNGRPGSHDVYQAVWSLIKQGLAYLDCSDLHASNWSLHLSESCRSAARDGECNPYNSDDYLKALAKKVPDASPAVLQYAREALISFRNGCYLASAVMLGVASEAAFLEMAGSLGNLLQDDEEKRFREVIRSQKQNYLTKFAEFRKRIEAHKSQLPAELADNMALTMDAVLDLLRVYRNESGHPTGKQIGWDDAFTTLHMFPSLLKKLYDLKAFLEQQSTG